MKGNSRFAMFNANTVAITIWLLLPAYTPNNFAVVLGGGRPIDLGKKFIDGRRILGNGKTIRGFIAGVTGGLSVVHLQLLTENFLGIELYSSLEYPSFFILASCLAFGALMGDLIGSFVKRRIGLERGVSLPVLDQLGFLIIAFALAYLFSPDFKRLFTMQIILTGIVITPPLHLLTNYIAYKLGLKEVPW
jgi:CDP-2,3-bis-(O-geranylgeranyl)-sn-glycerol synthase